MQSLLPIFQCTQCDHNLCKVRYMVPVVLHTLHFLLFSLDVCLMVSSPPKPSFSTQATLNHDFTYPILYTYEISCGFIQCAKEIQIFPLPLDEELRL